MHAFNGTSGQKKGYQQITGPFNFEKLHIFPPE
jgi:hypothetical protein